MNKVLLIITAGLKLPKLIFLSKRAFPDPICSTWTCLASMTLTTLQFLRAAAIRLSSIVFPRYLKLLCYQLFETSPTPPLPFLCLDSHTRKVKQSSLGSSTKFDSELLQFSESTLEKNFLRPMYTCSIILPSKKGQNMNVKTTIGDSVIISESTSYFVIKKIITYLNSQKEGITNNTGFHMFSSLYSSFRLQFFLQAVSNRTSSCNSLYFYQRTSRKRCNCIANPSWVFPFFEVRSIDGIYFLEVGEVGKENRGFGNTTEGRI